MLDELSEGELTSIITTEHFTLQTARAAAIAQANGRATTYMGVLSSSLIALALVGQTTGFEQVLLRLRAAAFRSTRYSRSLHVRTNDAAGARGCLIRNADQPTTPPAGFHKPRRAQ
jgi:hypothetical protein